MVLYPAVSVVSINPAGSHNHPARDARTLAQSWLSLLLALEGAPTGRATADRHGAARAGPADERGEPALGCATHPRRTAQAWVWRRSINRRQVHGQATWTSESGMADLSAKPRSGHCRHGSVRGPDHWLRSALYLDHHEARS